MPDSVVLERVQTSTAGTVRFANEQLARRRVYIFPTAQGWIYAVMLIVMLLGAINYSNSMAFMLCFLLSGLAIVCMLHTWRNLAGLIIHAGKPVPVFNGQSALFPLHFDNLCGQERVDIVVRQKPVQAGPRNTVMARVYVEADKQEVVQLPVQARQRGLLKTGAFIIESQFPLGIFRAWSYFDHDQVCLVYPKPAGDKTLPRKSELDDDFEQGKQAGTDDFAGFRKYRPGDATRSIAWKAFAREQGLHVKQFSGTGSATLILGWNNVAHIGEIEARLSQLCLWVILAEELGIQYGLAIPGVDIDPANGETHRHHCLEKLALYGLSDASG